MQSTTYTIMEAARMCGLPESTLRYYESIDLIGPIERGPTNGHRIYSEDDVNKLVAIACLNTTGMKLADMRHYLKNINQDRVEVASEQVRLLESQKQRLEQKLRDINLRQRYIDNKVRYWQSIQAGDISEIDAIQREAVRIASQLKLPMT